jgi:hypothetical protein
VQVDRSFHEQQQQQQQPCASPLKPDACTQRSPGATDYIACAAVSCGGMGDFVPAPRCSVMRHAVLKADVQQPRHCSSAHYEQLLCVGPPRTAALPAQPRLPV